MWWVRFLIWIGWLKTFKNRDGENSMIYTEVTFAKYRGMIYVINVEHVNESIFFQREIDFIKGRFDGRQK